MAVGPRRNRRRPVGALVFLGFLILSLGWVLYLRLTDQPIRDPFGFYQPADELPTSNVNLKRPPVMPPAEGKVRVLMSARAIPAFSAVNRDDLFDSTRGIFAFIDLDEDFVEENGILLGTGPILGRVLKRTKRPGFAFTESDFLPKGTRPGLAGGIPPGMRAFRIEVGVVEGIIGLNAGDRFDIVAASVVQPKTPRADVAPVGLELTGLYSQQARQSSPGPARDPAGSSQKSRVEVLVSNGVIIYPLDTRLIPTASTGLMTGQVTGTRPVQEMVIAIPTESVAPLMAAIQVESQLTCVARSGRPEEDPDNVMPGFNLVEGEDEGDSGEGRSAEQSGVGSMPAGYEGGEFTIIETIMGGERALTAVPRASSDAADGDGGGDW